MPRIAIIDTYYSEFLKTLPDPSNGNYEIELRQLLDRAFGTADFYSHALTAEGWTCLDIIANYDRLQQRWAQERFGSNGISIKAIALQQIEDFHPDVVFIQDLSYFNAAELSGLSKKYLLAGQCSCAIHPGKYSDISVMFTSLPKHVQRFKDLGISMVEYLPLAFDPRMLSEESPKKQFEISFVGGVGKRSHWKAGTEILERVAEVFKERFIWFGYGVENLEKGSPLIPCYGGPAWGREMYSVYGRSKIVINRHGEIAEGFSNNLRMFEATGMGAVLITERNRNLYDLWPVGTSSYSDADDLIERCNAYLNVSAEIRNENAKAAQRHTLSSHTYARRMKIVSEVLMKALDKVAA